MPIGKNAIKRVTNSGYSNVQTTAPDMENSTIEKSTKSSATPKKTTIKAKAEPKATKTTKKATPTPKKSMEKEPDLSPVKTAEKVIKKSAKAQTRQGSCYINIGGELPIYLL